MTVLEVLEKTRANIKLATLNIRGCTSASLGQNQISKWIAINREMRDQKIGVLCVQETHLCPEHQTQIDSLYARRLLVLNLSDPSRPGSSAGVAFILNKEITNTASARLHIITPGQAIILSINWHDNKTINILNVNFWNTVQSELHRRGLESIDFLMGDFNLTEDPIDRAPARLDNESTIDALRDLRSSLNLQDTWRIENPHQRLFTFSSNHQSLSRLDRIYTSDRHTESLLEWSSLISQIPTDHQMVSIRFAPSDLPHIGKGRWSWPPSLISDTSLINRIIETGIKTQLTIENGTPRTEESNPQTIWQDFKTNINKIAKDTAKTHLHKIHQRIRTLSKDLHKLANVNDINTSENTRLNEIILEKEIQHLQKKNFRKMTLKAQAQWASHGETISRYWKRALAEIPIEQKLTNPPDRMNETLKEEHVLEALLLSKLGSATGLDGVPYDVWKILHRKHQEMTQNEKPSFNIIKQ
ncbi:Endonuclease/exonuclease/phosphatase [Suillus ampliporus]|nr:Endonuclease/exonuclease/phosphatase [Suillus ampliporus]